MAVETLLLVWDAHGGFHLVTSCHVILPSKDPPKFLCYVYTKAILGSTLVIGGSTDLLELYWL
jgi:hypothetical protein